MVLYSYSERPKTDFANVEPSETLLRSELVVREKIAKIKELERDKPIGYKGDIIEIKRELKLSRIVTPHC